MEKDIVIIGGGPGGYTAAIRAAQLGAGVALVEHERLGGTCLNRGCIPTKALYKSAQMTDELGRAGEFGIRLDGFAADAAGMFRRKEQIVDRLTAGVRQLLKANSVEVVYGKAGLIAGGMVEISGTAGNTRIKAGNIIIATGSIPARLPIPGTDLPGVMTSDEILSGADIPGSLVIVGGGVVGIEFAGIFNALGSKVTVVEILPRILANMDGEISRRLQLSLKKRGVSFETEARVKEITKTEDGLGVLVAGKKGETLLGAEAVLVSTGRTPNVDGLNLDSLGIEHDRNGIKVDESYRTRIPGIYAVGDVIGGQMLAHVASEEGKAAVENILDLKGHMNYEAVPNCVFSFPEAAAVGLTEEEAAEKGIDYRSSRFLFGANGKALTMGEEEGFVKVLADTRTGRIAGVHILGPHASDLIHEAVLAVANQMTADDLSRIVHAHPTLSEAFMEAALGLENRAIHMQPRKPVK